MVQLNLNEDDIENLLDFFNIMWVQYMKDLFNIDELDNIDFLNSMWRIHFELEKAANDNKRKEKKMSDLYAYTPEFCDGDFCPMNCDNCYKRDMQLEKEEEYEDGERRDNCE